MAPPPPPARPPAEVPRWHTADAQVVVADPSRPELDDDTDHHLRRVLRLRPGAPVCAIDGRGRWRLCVLGPSGLDPTGDGGDEPSPTPRLTVGFAPVKGDRPEWVVQKLTELGIDRIVVVHASRSVVRWEGDRLARHLDRLRRIAAGAVCQSRRLHLPEVSSATSGELVAQAGAVLADVGGRGLGPADHTVVVGPEGGWTDGERGSAEVVGLGAHVLRAETAAIAAGVLLGGLRVGLSGPPLSSSHPE